jgi:KDO2-lipid IV(A) lauroyltransferase
MKLARTPVLGPLINHLEYLFFMAARKALKGVRPESARTIGRRIGSLAWQMLPKRRRIATENATRVFGAAGRDIARRSFAHFGQVMAEMMRAESLYAGEAWRTHAEFEGRANLDRALASGKGVLCVGAHFGNWEIGGFLMSMLGYPVTAIERPLRNPLIHSELNAFRRATGQRTLAKSGAMKGAVRVLRSGEILALLADQDARRDGIHVDFMGAPASTHRAPATLSLKFEAPIVTFAVPRLPDGRYRILFDEPFVAEDTRNFEDDVRRATQRLTSALEGHIRRWPDQWLWMHRRWKTALLPGEGKPPSGIRVGDVTGAAGVPAVDAT